MHLKNKRRGLKVMGTVPVNDKILHRARELQHDLQLATRHRVKLNQIVKGEIKSVGAEWWHEVHRTINRRRRNKVQRLFKLSPVAGERRAAIAALNRLDEASPPGLEEYDRQVQRSAVADQVDAEVSKMFDAFE